MVRFISKARDFLKRLFSQSSIGETLPQQGDGRREIEAVTFGLNERGKYNAKPLAPRKKALMPRHIGGRWELSTFCIDGLQEEAIWALLSIHFTQKPAIARSDFRRDDILNIQPLSLEPNWEPERHVDICGWPEAEEARASLAQCLADIAKTSLAPRPASTTTA